MSKPILDLTNKRFGRLLVIKPSKQKHPYYHTIWQCLCDCGNIHFVSSFQLRQQNTTSCGCLKKDIEDFRTKTDYREFRVTSYRTNINFEFLVWRNIKNKCYNKDNKYYKYYGEKKIEMDTRWRTSFKSFIKDMKKVDNYYYILKRKDPKKDFNKDNCYWFKVNTFKLYSKQNKNKETKFSILFKEYMKEKDT